MAKQRIEPRFDDSPAAGDERERFIVEPRQARRAQPQLAPSADEEPNDQNVLRRLAWAIVLLGLGFVAAKGIGWYADQSDSPALQHVVQRVEQGFGQARQQMLRIPARQLPRTSSEGRDLREQCDALGRAFVSNPQPEVREQMLEACQAYERFRLSRQAAAEATTPSN